MLHQLWHFDCESKISPDCPNRVGHGVDVAATSREEAIELLRNGLCGFMVMDGLEICAECAESAEIEYQEIGE